MVGLQSFRLKRTFDRAVPSQRTSARTGYTLLELLIVAALLSLIASLTLPSFQRLAARSEVQEAGRQLRVALLEARLAAIESGHLTYFRYQLGNDQFEIGRAAGTSQPRQTPGGGGAPAWGDVDVEPTAEPRALSRGIRFVDPSADGQHEPSATAVGSDDASSWSEPLLFFPNGRTFNARIALASNSHRVELRVRGLTGTVQVSRAERLLLLDTQDAPQTTEVMP